MTRRACIPLKVGRVYTQQTTRFMVPALFWVTGVLGILTGFWRLSTVRRLVLQGGVGQGSVIAAVQFFRWLGSPC